MTGTSRTTRWQSIVVAFSMVASLVAVLPAQPAPAQTAPLTVDINDAACDDSGTATNYCSIGAAIGDAATGDTIQVAPGTYTENLFIGSQTLTIRSTGGAAVTTIQSPGPDASIITVNTGVLTVDGFTVTGADIPSFANGGGLFVNNSSGTANVINSVFTGNSTVARGAGIANFGTLTVTNSRVVNNSSASGGGIFNSGTATVVNSEVSNNSGTDGGGIHNSTFGSPTLTVQDSTIANNTATSRGGGISNSVGTTSVEGTLITSNTSPSGAGIHVGSTGGTGIDVQVTNSTIANNNGAGVLADATADANLYFVTVSGNSVGVSGNQTNTIVLARSLVAGNGSDCVGTAGLAAYNLIGIEPAGCALTSVGTGDQVGTPTAPIDPLLGPLADNGGPTQTFALLSGSPAIDAEPGFACLPEDQRGEPRPEPGGTACDIGAFEVQASTPLQDLIDGADPGDTIIVPPGVYTESIIVGDDISLVGGGATAADTVVDATGLNARTVTLSGTTSDNAAFENLTITGGESTSQGGNILNDSAELTLTDVIVANGSAQAGGGVFSSGVLTVSGSTIVGNTATGGDGGGIGGLGTISVVNSTIQGNDASGDGGGLSLVSGNARINNVTLVGNSAGGSGAAFNAEAGTIEISNSLSAANSSDGGPNCATLVSLGHNLLGGDPGCVLRSTDTIGSGTLGPLANNGGRTPTRALLEGHPAIDSGSTLTYTAFDAGTISDWQLNGSATTDSGELLLAAPFFQAGSAFLADPVAINDFSAQFDFRVLPQAGGGADGITFTITDSEFSLGANGGSLGIGGTTAVNGVSVEFDTWVNGTGVGADDPNGNHIGINIDGSVDSIPLGAGGTVTPTESLSDGSVWTAWIDYDGTTLEVRASNDGVRPIAPTLSADVDIDTLLDSADGYVGFTGATGSDGISGEQRVQNFTFSTGEPCAATDQRGVARPQALRCDIGAFELEAAPASPTSIDVSLVNDGPAVPPESPIIPIDGDSGALYFDVLNGPASTQLGAIQLGAIQLGAIQLGAIQLGAIGAADPIAYLDGAVLVQAAGQLQAAQLGAIGPLEEITLVDIPIPGGWEPILAGSSLAGQPTYTITLAQALADPVVAPAFESLKLFESGIVASQLGAIPLEVYALGAIQLGAIADAVGQGEIDAVIADLCTADPTVCSDFGIDETDPATYNDLSLASASILGAQLGAIQLGAIQLGAIDLTGVQLGAIQLGAIDLLNSQLGAIQLGAIQLGAIQLGAIQLGAIEAAIDTAVVPGGTYDDLVAYWCANGLDCSVFPQDTAGDPILDDYSILALGAMGAQLGAIQLGAIQLGAIDLADTQLGAIQLGAIDLAASQLGAIQLGAIDPTGAQLGAIQLGAIDVVGSQLGAIQLGAINLNASQLGAIQLGAIQLGAIDSVVDCTKLPGQTCVGNETLTLLQAAQLGAIRPGADLADLDEAFGSLTLQDLLDGNAGLLTDILDLTIADWELTSTVADLPPGLTLEEIKELWGATTVLELLLALISPSDLAWEDLDPSDLALETPLLIEGLSTQFTVNADPIGEPAAALPFTAVITLEIPDGIETTLPTQISVQDPSGTILLPPPPGSYVPLPEPTTAGNTVRWVLSGVEANMFYHLAFGTETFITADSSASIRTTVTALGVTGSADRGVTVNELEPNDTFADASSLPDDAIALGLIDSTTDVDIYSFTVPAGAEVEAALNGGGADLDLVLFEPGTGGNELIRGAPEQTVDGSLDPILGVSEADEQDPEALAETQNVPNAEGYPVYKASLRRGDAGERIVTPPLATPGTYYLQVNGFNGEISATGPYSLRLQVISQADRGPCTPRTFPFPGATVVSPTALPVPGALPADVETLFIVNEERYASTFGSTALDDLQSSLAALLGSAAAPVGAVIPVDRDGTVAAAYAALDAERCNPSTSNGVVDAIGDLVDGYVAANPTITSVVLVGGDDLIPHARVRDTTTIANEREYVNEFAGNNELVGALAAGTVLTDDPYVDTNPLYVPQGNRQVFIPTLAIGRLVESDTEIEAALDQFVLSSGVLDIATQQTASIFSYDFLADMGEAVRDELEDDFFPIAVPNENVYISESWTDTDWAGELAEAAAVISSNAHYDNDEGLPALSNSGASANLFDLTDLPASLEGSIIYSVGCHSGLNVPATYTETGDPEADWAQAILARDAVYIANTGFGYGDDTFIGYSEALMLEFTKNFSEVNTIGEALQYAKAQRALDTFAWSPYDDKALMESTLYGLPFYKLREVPLVPEAFDPIDATLDGDLYTTSVTAAGGLPQAISTDEGSYIPTDTLIQVPFRPVQPGEAIDVTAKVDGTPAPLEARGALVTSLASTDTSGVDAVYARAILYDADFEPELEADGPFPTVLHQIRRGETFDGLRDFLILARGRYFPGDTPGDGIQRVYESVGATVYYAAPGNADVTPPKIPLSKALDLNGTITFEVTATDASGIERVIILYKAVGFDGAWTPLELSQGTGDTWTGTATSVNSDVQYWVQVLDGSGLVSASSDKGLLHLVEQPGPPTIGLDNNGSNGWITSPATAALTAPANAPAAKLEYSLDGGTTFQDYTGPVPLPEGTNTLTARPKNVSASEVETEIDVDTVAPTVTITSPVAGQAVAVGRTVGLNYSCADTTSGIASCAGPVGSGGVVTATALGIQTVTVQGTDRAGNVATSTVTFNVVDHIEEPSLLVIEPSVTPLGSPVDATVTFSGSDSHSVEFDWGDGTSEPAAGETASHIYAQPGVYLVTATIQHDSFVETITEFAVVYDPSAGFVTGGGWIDSPLGAYTPDPTLTGKANFGFVSKYKKGQSVPDGDTTFKFKAAGLEFESTEYDWLVIAGARAQYKGSGTINETGDFGFILTAIDAALTPSSDVDLFRIKIWDKATDEVVYDNQLGAADGDDPTTAIGGGSIVIHEPPRGRNR